ncbi:MAG: GTP cyclohydrolase [Deltaproteobacteria bacterium]|nr:GTP cyclohydrolase [Deltaproteobacteria bacterium]
MFTYLNPEIRERLIEEGKLIRIDAQGQRLDPRAQPPADTLALNVLGPIPLPMGIGEHPTTVDWYAAVRSTELGEVESLAGTLRDSGGQHLFSVLASSMAVNSVLVAGNPRSAESPLVRVHSSCLTGDVFGSHRCECGPQLSAATDRIATDPQGGILVYMAGHEGRGIGLWAKAATYILQDEGENTYQANRSLGLPDDSRDFSDAGALLHYFRGNRPFRLLTNNPKKIEDLGAFGLDQITRVKHVTGVGDWNRRYLSAKQDWGHQIDAEDLKAED